jgi:hypothetical protein
MKGCRVRAEATSSYVEKRGGSQFRNTLLSDYPHTPMTCILRTASLPPALLSASTSEKINSTIVHDSLLWGPRR